MGSSVNSDGSGMGRSISIGWGPGPPHPKRPEKINPDPCGPLGQPKGYVGCRATDSKDKSA